MSSVVVAVKDPLTSVGALTQEHPGLAVRMTAADEILEDGLDVFCEMTGAGSKQRHAVLDRLAAYYNADIKVTQDRDDILRANACIHDIEAVRSTPVFDAVLAQRRFGDRLVIVHAEGRSILRIDLPTNATDEQAQRMVTILLHAAQLTDPDASVHVARLAKDLDDWDPLQHIPSA